MNPEDRSSNPGPGSPQNGGSEKPGLLLGQEGQVQPEAGRGLKEQSGETMETKVVNLTVESVY